MAKVSSTFQQPFPRRFAVIWVLFTLATLVLVFVIEDFLSTTQYIITTLYGCIVLLSYLLFLFVKYHLTYYYSLHRAMKLALKQGAFYPLFQPIMDIRNTSCAGVEILLRWCGKEDEILMPEFFIEEAEASGLIVPITLHIMEVAFKQTQHILLQRPAFYLAFNLSALHFEDPFFLKQFNQLVSQYQISPTQIVLELTERRLLNQNDDILVKKMHALRRAGYSLAIDDYGTGHASISYLQYFPFNYLKIDKLFIQAIGTKAITESLNDAIIKMAMDLELTLVAEGVETKTQLDYLAERNVYFLQGWYFSEALTIAQLKELLEKQ